MAYFINKKKEKIHYKSLKGKSPGIIFIHGLNSDMSGQKALSIEKYARKISFVLFVLSAEVMVNLTENLKILQSLIGKKI